jgi:hypothetical protein
MSQILFLRPLLTSEPEEAMIEDIFEYIDVIFSMVRPRRLLYLVLRWQDFVKQSHTHVVQSKAG